MVLKLPAGNREPLRLLGTGLALCLGVLFVFNFNLLLRSAPPPSIGTRPLAAVHLFAAAPASAPSGLATSASVAPAEREALPPAPAVQAPAPISPVGLAVTGGLLLAADVGRDQVLARPLLGGPWRVFAGSGFAGYGGDGGPAVDAQLNAPQGLAVDPAGNTYIADSSNHAIRKVAVDGTIRTIGGIGLRGFSGDGGPAIAARLDSPAAVAVGPDGSLFIADKGNHRVRRVDSGGIITTVAGSGLVSVVAGSGGFGFSGDGGPATAAQLSAPEGVAAGPNGELYVADTGNDRVRTVSTAGVITTIAGGGRDRLSHEIEVATRAEMRAPVGLAIDATGGLLIGERGGQVIRRLSGTLLTRVTGTGTRGAEPGLLDDPGALVLAGARLYISETGSGRVTDLEWR